MNPQPITVIATLQAKPGQEASLRQALLSLIEPSRRDQGCLNYNLHVSPDQPGLFLFHENWTSRAALDAHLAQPHVQAVLSRADELLASPPSLAFWSKLA